MSKITPLFGRKKKFWDISKEKLIRFLDESPENASKREFLNACAADMDLRKAWDFVKFSVSSGKDLPEHEPDPSLRSRILEAAYQEMIHPSPLDEEAEKKTVRFQLSGWRWAWAAIFLVISWGGYEQITHQPAVPPSVDVMEQELLTLEREIEELHNSMIYEFNFDAEEKA